MRKDVILIFVLMVLMASAVSAEILVGQPKEIYNLGDKVEIEIITKPNVDVNNIFSASLSCADRNETKSIEIYKKQLSIKANAEEKFNVSTILSKSVIGELRGKCSISLSYGGESAKSQDFELTNLINVNMEVGRFNFNPGESVKVTGTAVKKNGQNANGFVEIKIEGINFSLNRETKDGKFDFSFNLPEIISTGSYPINSRVYEKEGNEVSNEGSGGVAISVRQVPKKLDIALNAQTIMPGNELSYSAIVYDQAESQVSGSDVGIVISDPNGNSVLKKLVKSGETYSLLFEKNSTPGYWKIEAKAGDFAKSKLVNVEELAEALFSIVNKSLIVKNVGNVPYEKQIEIAIGKEIELLQLELKLGESKEFLLSAPDGKYEIKVSDGAKSNTIGSVALTGKTTEISDVKENIFSQNIYVFVWIIVILILFFAAIYLHKKIAKKKFFAKAPKESKEIRESGERQEATVVALKIDNLPEAERNESSKEAINEALAKAKSAKANIYTDGNCKIMIFAPITTGTKENEICALKAAKEINEYLNNYNNKFGTKIKFGIGVNAGEMIVEKTGGKFRYTSIGNTIAGAKRTANLGVAGVLMTDVVHRKAASVKGSRLPSLNAWKVDKIPERAQHSEFIKGFLRRQGK